jgi:hypothetical protein
MDVHRVACSNLDIDVNIHWICRPLSKSDPRKDRVHSLQQEVLGLDIWSDRYGPIHIMCRDSHIGLRDKKGISESVVPFGQSPDFLD